jgi:hypothetical protein
MWRACLFDIWLGLGVEWHGEVRRLVERLWVVLCWGEGEGEERELLGKGADRAWAR